MMITGKAHGQVVLASDLDTAFHYFADHKKILGFNPFCKEVVETDIPDVYRWDFEIMDPYSHPIQLIFYVRQSYQKQEQEPNSQKDDNLISQSELVRQIFWSGIPIEFEEPPPNDYTFVGLASGQMLLKKLAEQSTFVDVFMRVDIDFQVPILLRIFPEPFIKMMAEAAMSAGMQTVSNKMLEKISKDFHCSALRTEQTGEVKLN